MLRMAHRMMMDKVMMKIPRGLSRENAIEVGKTLQRACAKAQVVIADNVAVYVQSIAKFVATDYSAEKIAILDMKDVPNALPPFDTLFIEWVPAGEDERSDVLIAGVLFQIATNAQVTQNGWNPDHKHIAAMHVYCNKAGQVIYDGNYAKFECDKNGTMLPDSMTRVEGAEFYDIPLAVPQMAISFMHCKNVVQYDATDTEGPSDKWRRRQRAPVIRYHVLDINPMKEVLRTEGGVETNGLKKALHICRGHFATYTAEKPLFGNFVGTVWKPAHVRGDIKQGAVVKDYSVSPQ